MSNISISLPEDLQAYVDEQITKDGRLVGTGKK
jgi:Arc/MetJ-type ribon-helix-helix transcriptional regulator